ncbi:MAG: site-2 protease family protein [Proteobacteria bacterium]|nr:site-2 protease family protein [Pseudomonadota bacterium]
MDFLALLPKALTWFLAMLFSLSFHEAAHAFSAKICGDKTAERLGRLTLNPVAHADILGTIVLPLVGLLAQLPVLGWAKPVPVDERNFRRWPDAFKAELKDHHAASLQALAKQLIAQSTQIPA